VSGDRRPILWVYATTSADPLAQLFSKRGFAVVVAGSVDMLGVLLTQATSEERAEAAIVDFDAPNAMRAAELLGAHDPAPILVAVADPEGQMGDQEAFDAAFVRPVDPARLFARVVHLLAERKKGPDSRRNRITGVVAVVRGNQLFQIAAHELETAVPPINAGAILEQALRGLGGEPTTIEKADLAAMLESGRLADALRGFGDSADIARALDRLAVRLRA
jgi:hypothetical protein